MGEVLSQDEIDNLLKALSSGELDVDEMKNGEEKQVKNYDFARPSKFSKEHLRTLEIIFEHFGRLLATNLPAYLRKTVSVDVVNSEVVIYSEFSNALSNPVLLGVVSMKPLAGNMVMEMASNLGFAIVDRLLGGAGAALDKERDFSEIELTIIERIFSICVNLLREPWENVIKLTPRLERIETNSQFAQIISPTETIAIITINLKIGDVEGLMNVCLPFTLLEPVMDKLNTKFWFANMQEKDPTMYGDVIENIISKTKVPIKAILGGSKVNVADFVNLQVGDISEAKAIKEVFGQHAFELNISSTKSMTGHLLGAAGAVEAIASILAIKNGIVPPTINHEEGDNDENIDYDLNLTFNKAQKREVNVALSNTFGFGGHNACVIFKKYAE